MKIVLQISAFLLISFLSFSQTLTQKKNETQAILALLDHQSKAWNEGNIDKFMEDYAKNDSILFIGKSGVTMGWKATLERYKKSYPDKATMGTLKFSIKKIDFIATNACWILGEFYLTRPEKGDAKGIFTLLIKKENNKNWKIFADHTTGY